MNRSAGYHIISYSDDSTESGIEEKVDKAATANAKSETFTSITDKRGNVRKVLYGTALQVSSSYTDDNKISSITDAVSGTFNYT